MLHRISLSPTHVHPLQSFRAKHHRREAAQTPVCETPVCMVQVGERGWTQDVLHTACQRARLEHGSIALVIMVPAQYIGWLGTDLGYRNLPETTHDSTRDFLATIEDYGLEATVIEFQYATWVEGTIQAAEFVGASEVYAGTPPALWKPVCRLLTWTMERQLRHQGRVWVH